MVYHGSGKSVGVKPIVMKAALSTEHPLYCIFNVQDSDLNHQVEIRDFNKGDDTNGDGALIWRLKSCKVTGYSCSGHNAVESALLEETVTLDPRDFELVVPAKNRRGHGYSVVVRWDDSNNWFVAQCNELIGCIGTSTTIDGAVSRVYDSIDTCLDLSAWLGIKPPIPNETHGKSVTIRPGK
jgi:predicted RNase H-like HicB family nuclease